MNRVLSGGLFVVGLLVATIATWNIYFGTPPVSQIILGAIGLGLAVFFAITLRENPDIRRIAVFALLALTILMVVPAAWSALQGTSLNALQITIALLGAIIFFVNMRMLPR